MIGPLITGSKMQQAIVGTEPGTKHKAQSKIKTQKSKIPTGARRQEAEGAGLQTQ